MGRKGVRVLGGSLSFAVLMLATACTDGGDNEAAAETTRPSVTTSSSSASGATTTSAAVGTVTTVVPAVTRGLQFMDPGFDRDLVSAASGGSLGWQSLGGQCLVVGADCTYAVSFTHRTGDTGPWEEAWLVRLVERRAGKPVWRLLDRHRVPDARSLHSGWNCLDRAAGRFALTVGPAADPTVRLISFSTATGHFVPAEPARFPCSPEGD